MREMLDTDWMTAGACRGLYDIMFPPDGTSGQQRRRLYGEAKQICADCPVHDACLEWALLDPVPIEGGVIAGLSPEELRIARQVRLADRRANAVPKCGTERAYALHVERGETCEYCSHNHARKNQRYAEAS